jgi:hypothetical protein
MTVRQGGRKAGRQVGRQAGSSIDLGKHRVSIHQPEHATQIFSNIPKFSSSAEPCRHLKQRLVASCRACALQNFDFMALEPCCLQPLLVDASGVPPRLLPPDRARYSREHVGSDVIGWLHFQPICDQRVANQPDMFD